MGLQNKFKHGILFAVFLLGGCTPGLNHKSSVSTAIISLLNSLTGNGTFTLGQSMSVGATPYIITTGDFNHDGKMDIASANFGDGTVSVSLGNGDGTFQAPVNYVVGAGGDTMYIVAADFNNDGKLDLAISKWGGFATVLLGNGDGTFGAPVDYPVGTGSYDVYKIVAADFNHDGKMDLAVATSWTGTIAVLLGNGDGTFQPQVEYQVGGGAAASVCVVGLGVGDFNGDGILDLIATDTNTNSMAVSLGNGDGTFQPSGAFFNIGDWPESLTVVDLNHDGKLDVVATNPDIYSAATGDSISVMMGNGDGTFQPLVRYVTPGSAKQVAVGDYNGDGKTDLAVTSYDGHLSILLGNGDGTFQPNLDTAILGGDAHGIAAADFNGDGVSDLCVSSDTANTLNIFLGNH